MKRHLTEHLGELAEPALGEALAGGEGFEVILAGAPVPWRQTAAPMRQNGTWVWQLAQAEGPLRAKSSLDLRPAHRAARWRVELSNSAREPVTIDALYPLVVRFPRLDGPWRTLTAGGGSSENFYPPRAYAPRERVVFGGEVRIESPPGGRSSDRHLPLMLAVAGQAEDGPGLFCGMEFSGRWLLCLRHVNNSPFFRGELKLTGVVLSPGETVVLPAAHVGFFGGGLEGGTNALRRYVRDCVCPPPVAPGRWPPVSYDHWFGITNHFDEPLLRRQVVRAAELGVEYWVHDAGWFEGGFPAGAGNWHRPDPAKYPEGLGGLADFVRGHGMKFGLWLEIERAGAGTWAVREHPELFFPAQSSWSGPSHHLNLAEPAAVDWAIATIGRWITELELEWVRWDYNIDPAGFFLAADPSGKIELAYYQGLYRVLDALLGEHPRLVMEACSGGGRRIDLGTLRRAHVAWISDQTQTPDICRYMQCRLGRFLPGALANSAVAVNLGQGAAPFGEGDILARMCGALSFSGDVAGWAPGFARKVRGWVDAYKQVRHLLQGDFHQLAATPTSDRDWDVVQFSSADGGESALFAFRMAGGLERAAPKPRGIDPAGSYLVTNLARPGRPRTIPGARLVGPGLPVRLNPCSSVCFHISPT